MHESEKEEFHTYENNETEPIPPSFNLITDESLTTDVVNVLQKVAKNFKKISQTKQASK